MVAPVQWLLGGLAVVTVVELVWRVGSAVAARGARGPVPEGLVAGLVAVVGVVLLVLTSGYRTTNAVAVAERYADSPINRIGPDDLAAFAYLRATVGPGERVMNSANDGSTYAYVLDRVPVVEVDSLGSGAYTEELLARFDRLATDPDVRALVRRLDIRWVLVDADAPAIGVFEPDYPWYHGGNQFTTPPVSRTSTGSTVWSDGSAPARCRFTRCATACSRITPRRTGDRLDVPGQDVGDGGAA